MTSDAGIKRSHNTDSRTLGRFLGFCIEKGKFITDGVVHHRRSLLVCLWSSSLPKWSTTIEACWFVRKVHHCRSSLPPLKPTGSFINIHHNHQSSSSLESNIQHSHGGLPTVRKDHHIPIFRASRSSYSRMESPFSFGYPFL